MRHATAARAGKVAADHGPLLLHSLPEGLLKTPAQELHRLLPGPTLIRLPGLEPEPLVISVLQHGDEYSGWEAIRGLLQTQYTGAPLPRSLWLWIGNPQAARHGHRRLPDQPDFNRCWPYAGRPPATTAEAREVAMFARVTDRLRAAQPIAVIDVHNNSGRNPHYAAINRLHWASYNLARGFSEVVVYFTSPPGTMANACADFCPSVTLECGLAGDARGIDRTMAFFDACLHLAAPDHRPRAVGGGLVHHMMAAVYISPGVEFAFHPQAAPIRFRADLDLLNFRPLPAGTLLADIDTRISSCVLAIDAQGHDITAETFSFENGELRSRRAIIPSMLTLNERVIRQDCLCYLMETLDPFPEHAEQCFSPER